MLRRTRVAGFACLLLAIAWLIFGALAVRADTFVFETPDGRQTVEGKLAARTSGEVLFLGRDGHMYLKDAARVIDLRQDDQPLKPFTKEETIAQLRSEFGRGFDSLSTNHYLICFSTDAGFAKSCGVLFERLHKAFTNYFEQRKIPVRTPDQPLVAIIYGDEHDFLECARRELGEKMAANVIGFYSFVTNRMVLYDMQAHPGRAGLGNVVAGNPPQPPRGVEAFNEVSLSTIIHEATHQLAYNSGFHQRFSDNPLWLAEGMAMFFEAPNRVAGEWRNVGEINRPRLDLFRQEHLLPNSKPVDIESLIRDDKRLKDNRTALAAYADSWALSYYLLKTHRDQFCDYLRILAKKPPLAQDDPDQRLADFRAAFGDDIAKLQRQFVRHMQNLAFH